MPHIFISYAKRDTRKLAESLYQLLVTVPGVTTWMDMSLEADASWAYQIQQEIDRADYVIVLLSPDVNRPVTGKQRRSFVLNEIDYAQQDNKPILPILVLQTKMPVQLAGIQYIDLRTAPDNPEPIVKRVCERFSLEWTTRPEQSAIQVKTGWSQGLLTRRAMIGLGASVLFLIISVIALSSLNQADIPNPAIAGVTTPDLTRTLDTMVTSILATNMANETITAAAFTSTPTPTDTPTATDTPDMTQTLAAQNTEAAVIAANFLATQQSQLTANAPTNTPQPTATSTATPTATPTATETSTITPTATLDLPATAAAATRLQQEALATVNAQATQAAQATLPPAETLAPLGVVVSSHNINLRSGPGTDNAFVAVLPPGTRVTVLENAGAWLRVRLANGTEGYIASTLLDVIGTPTPTWTPNPTIAALAQIRVTSNADWTPYERDFNDVTMVLVPAGCFMMGSENGDDDEKPVNEQCFDIPFWIDKYEVTNAQYGSTGCESFSSEPDQPRNCVNWFDAQDFCEARGGRLPTEAEWEYAARGPDSLAYPWGNEFIADNVVYDANAEQTAEVGSRPAGASWVGALDMSGNGWEWVSSLYQYYPYSDDHESNTDTSSGRVLRGGSFFNSSFNLRAAYRLGYNPGNVDGGGGFGFRCARS